MRLAVLALALLQAAAGAELTRDERMAWWREARFGMFIHWGLYSVLGGEWQGLDYGKEMGGASAEWIMLSAKIPRDDYAALAKQFNPVKFDARTWVGLAKQAGMKYIVITAKHHDGFSMFGSTLTPYNVVDATPFHRDVVKELAAECRRQGLKFGVYYSHSRDWYNRKFVQTDPDPPSPQYADFVRGQLRELLTGYGDLGIVWFDTGDRFTDVNSSYGHLVRQLQPRCLISGRLNGGDGASDYSQLGDRRIPPQRVAGDVETPMTLRDNWGYDRDEDNWKSGRDILQRFCLTVCRGANMLLNVGPRPDGQFSPQEVERLETIGRWMKVNGEAIHGTTAGPFDYDFDWGAISRKAGRFYLHVLKWDPAGIAFDGLKTKVTRAYLLADRAKALPLHQELEAGHIRISVPARAPDENVSVIALELAGPVVVDDHATGTYHWNKGVDIKLNQEKIARQKAIGWKPGPR